MLTKAQINAASATLDEVDVAMVITTVRGSDKYKSNPAYYGDIEDKITDVNGTVQAKQLNAALTAIADLGIGVVEIDQRRVGGSDGLYYSQLAERNALVDYILGVLYPEYFETVIAIYDDNGNLVNGEYRVAQREV